MPAPLSAPPPAPSGDACAPALPAVPVTVPAVPVDTSGCAHTRALRRSPDHLRRFRAGLRWGRMIRAGHVLMDEDDEPPEGVDSSKLLAYPDCSTCTVALHCPFLCLECALAACHVPARVPPGPSIDDESHMVEHLKQADHPLAVEIHSGAILCARCDDLVFDTHLHHIAQQEQRRVSHPTRGRKRHVPAGWDDKDDIKRTPEWKLAVPCKGPRGLRNMGATCYMNVVLQSFIHNPLLRNFFLSDRHNSSLCTNRENCLACELDLLFNEFFTGDADSTAFGPTNLLFTLWLARESSEIASTGQHDAHELFISMANAMHSALTQSNLGAPPLTQAEENGRHRSSALPSWPWESLYPPNTGHGRCSCAIHRTFSGTIQSDVTCQQCGRWNSTRDPFLDISLDLKPHKSSSIGGSGGKPQLDLMECLSRYTRAESLDVAGYSCPNCGSAQATKQLSFLRFPPVLCLQLKRFEHNSSASKIDNPIRYPLELDVRDYATSMVQGEVDKTLQDPEAYIYDLFTSVVHEGTLTTGHYTNYSKYRDQWYFYDDDKVRPVPAREALNGNAYQLCYRRRRLHNLATTDA